MISNFYEKFSQLFSSTLIDLKYKFVLSEFVNNLFLPLYEKKQVLRGFRNISESYAARHKKILSLGGILNLIISLRILSKVTHERGCLPVQNRAKLEKINPDFSKVQ